VPIPGLRSIQFSFSFPAFAINIKTSSVHFDSLISETPRSIDSTEHDVEAGDKLYQAALYSTSAQTKHASTNYSDPDAYILSFGALAMIIIYPRGDLSAIDAYFFGVSASTESELTRNITITLSQSRVGKLITLGVYSLDLKALKTYQQVFL
jgi:hypothetical protein